jgi:hypothetical protein
MGDDCCLICGDLKNKEYIIQLKCGHSFHYNCIFLTFKNTKENSCPLCRKHCDRLPLVNGIKKIYPYIHKIKENEDYINKPCQTILKRGKNKGNPCGKNCQLGFYECRIHHKINP